MYGNLFQMIIPANDGYAEEVGCKEKNKKLNL